jgi:hypothetical protein
MANQKNIHHLVWFDHLDQAKHCISGKKISQFSSDINVKSLLSENKQLANVFYSIINPCSTRFSKNCPELFDTYFAIQRGELISRIQKRNFFQFASRYGVADFISLISKNLEIFSEVITPDFKKLFIKLNPLALKKDALFFHNADPNYYLWIPNNYKLNEVIVCFGNFGNGIGFSMEDIPMCFSQFIFTAIIKSGGCAVVSIGNDHTILNNNCAHFFTYAM